MTDFHDRLRSIEARADARSQIRRDDPQVVVARRKALKKRRSRVSFWITMPVIMVAFPIYHLTWHDSVLAWLHMRGILPDYGVMALFDIRSRIDYDSVVLAGLVGGGAAGAIGLILAPLVRLVVR